MPLRGVPCAAPVPVLGVASGSSGSLRETQYANPKLLIFRLPSWCGTLMHDSNVQSTQHESGLRTARSSLCRSVQREAAAL